MKAFFKCVNNFFTIQPLGWLTAGTVASMFFILLLACNLAPRDPHPERTPSPRTSCTTYGEGTGLVCTEVAR